MNKNLFLLFCFLFGVLITLFGVLMILPTNAIGGEIVNCSQAQIEFAMRDVILEPLIIGVICGIVGPVLILFVWVLYKIFKSRRS